MVRRFLKVKITQRIQQATRKNPSKSFGNAYLCFLGDNNVVAAKTLEGANKLAKDFGFDGIYFE